MVACHGNTSWVNLCITRIGKESTTFVSSPCSRYVTTHCICRKEEYVSISTSTQQYRMSLVSFYFSRNHVTRNDTPRMSVRSEEHTSELQSRENLVCRLLLE